jgi:hypothetical protein
MSRHNKERDEMKARLAALATSPNSAGSRQAETVLKPKPAEPEIKSVQTEQNTTTTTHTTQTPEAAPARKTPPKPKPKPKPVKTSISLYPADFDALDKIEKGLAKGRYNVSELVRIALAGFDPKQADVNAILEQVRERDGRR